MSNEEITDEGEASDASEAIEAIEVDEVDPSDGAGELEPRDAAEQARRIERLRRALLASDPADLKRAVLALPAPSVETLAEAARVRVPVLRAGSIRSLRRVEDPVLLDLLAGIISDECLGTVRDLLGDEADDPSAEALAAAVDEVIDTKYPAPTVRLTLAMVAAGLAEAADICDRLLDSDPRFELPQEVEPTPAATVGALATSAASEEKRAARRARQAADAERRKAQQEKAAATADRQKAERKKASAVAAPDPDPDPEPMLVTTRVPQPAAETGSERAARMAPTLSITPVPVAEEAPRARRLPALVGDEAARFNPNDLLVGSVVIAEIVFDPDDPSQPDMGAKRRPCVVIGVSPTYLLVRPGYSDGGARSRDWTSYELRDRRDAGLDKTTWIETQHRRVDRDMVDEPVGNLSDRDWNALW